MARIAAARSQTVNILEAVRTESIAVRHFDLWQARSVEDLPFGNYFVAIENEGRQRVNIAGAERTLLFRRHGPIDVVPNGRGKRPIIGKRPRRRRGIERSSASD